MAVPVKGSFVGRFALKFVEVLGAGVATAVGSYFVAQLSGYWSSPAHTPAAVQIAPSTPSAPNASVVSKAPRVDADSSKLASTPDASAPAAAAQPARPTTTVNPAASRKRVPAEINVEAKPQEKEAKPQEKETAETKARDKDDKDSVEAQVRAALANVDASRQPPPAPQAATPAAPKTETPPSTGTVGSVHRAADIAPPGQPAPSLAPAEPLTPVEIKSHPIVDADAAAQAQADAQARADASPGNDKGLFAALKKIPEFFRNDAHPADEPPRPPKPVGE
jgi:hypothetical protein